MRKKEPKNSGKSYAKISKKAKIKSLPRNALRDLLNWFQNSNVKGVIIGGLAASLLGQPRTTKDIDATIWIDFESLAKFLEAGKQFGFFPRISNALEFSKKSRVLLLVHKSSKVPIDLSLGVLPFEEEMIQRRKTILMDDLHIPVARAEDLIIMKLIPRRPRDIADIEFLLEHNPKLDIERIRYWIKQIVETLEMPEILDDLEKLIRQSSKLYNKPK